MHNLISPSLLTCKVWSDSFDKTLEGTQLAPLKLGQCARDGLKIKVYDPNRPRNSKITQRAHAAARQLEH